MAGITIEEATDQLEVWLEASRAVAGNQSYTIAGRTLTRADAKEVREMLDYWDRKVRELTPGRGAGRARVGVPMP